MKIFLYLFLFLAVFGVIILGFFFIAPPQIPQTTITKTLDQREAFGSASTPRAAPPTTPSPAKASNP